METMKFYFDTTIIIVYAFNNHLGVFVWPGNIHDFVKWKKHIAEFYAIANPI